VGPRVPVEEYDTAPEHTEPIFRVSNHHGPTCGQPSVVDGDDSLRYYGYFENVYSEQFIFLYDRAERRGTFWCGDAGWEQPYPVVDGRVLPSQRLLGCGDEV